MIPDVKSDNVDRQEFIDLLCQMSKTDEEPTPTTTNTTNEPEITIIEDNSVVEEGEIITLDDDDDEKKEMEDGEITESQESDNDDVEVLSLRLNALRSLAGAHKQKRQKPKKLRPKRRRSNDNNRYINDDTDLRSTIRNRTSSRHLSQTSNHDDREYLLDKDYRQPSVFDRLLSLISPNHSKKLVDNYDVQHMDIVEDYPIVPPLPPLPPPPPPLPPSHLPFFDPLPPLPPPPLSLFNMFPFNPTFPSMNWPRPNFLPQQQQQVQTDLWQPAFNNSTDTDLRLQPISNHQHPMISPRMNEPLPHKRPQRKRSKKRRERRKSTSPPPVTTNTIEISQEPASADIDKDDDDDEEEERLLREQLLRTLSSKRKVTVVEPVNPEPERIVTIVPSNSPPSAPPLTVVVTNVNPTPAVVNKSQYSINQRYKRVKAQVTTKTETITTAAVARPTQPIIQTRNKIVRVPDTDIDIPQSNPIIITFDDPTTDEDEQQTTKPSIESTYQVADEERQAIKRLQQLQEEVIRRANAIESTTKTVTPKVAPTPVEVVQEAIPSTDELSALFEKRRMLLSERAKYEDIQEKMKKKKLENGLFAREIERYEEQILTKRAQITNNNALLQYWQKEAMAIVQNIKQQEEHILQSVVFKSTKPTTTAPVVKPPAFDYENISKVFEENNTQLFLSIFICPLTFYQKLRSYHTWLKTISNPITSSPENPSCLLLRTRSFPTQNDEQYWKTCLQAYFIDINHILCPYELQGSCKAQNCIFQHQHQITSRIDQFLSSKNFDEKNKQKILNNIDSLCSLHSFDIDLSIFERKIAEKQYQRCRIKLDRYLSIYHEDFRYFHDPSLSNSLSTIHPILVSVSNQLDSDDFSPERAVADLVEGLESQRTNAQLWCLYLELSSWQMSSQELHQLCNAAIKNSQSYDLFWTIFYLCTNNLEEFISTYLNFIQSDQFDFHSRSFAICELAMFHANLATTTDQAYQQIKNYLSNPLLENEHRVYLVLVLLYTFAFGSFPRILYLQINENRFIKSTDFEPFICPWNILSNYSHSQNEIDRFFDDFMNPMELSDGNLALYINKIHYLNATKRFEQSKVYIETLIEAFPCSIELWIELLSIPGQNITEILERARKSTGIYYEFVYTLSSNMDIKSMLNTELIPMKTFREKFFFDLMTHEINIERYNGELRDMVILDTLFHLSNFGFDIQRRMILKILDYLIPMNDHQKLLIIYSFFRILPINRVLDILIDCFLSNSTDLYEWVFKSFAYRLLDLSIQKDRNTLIWFRFDAFARQLLNHIHVQELYVTILQRLMASMETKSKIVRLCRLFEKHYPNCDMISHQLRQMIFNSTNTGMK